MIVVSGVLVVVAIVLLVFGVFVDGDTGVRLIYLCIGLSLTAGGLLAIGAYQRRGEQFPDANDADEPVPGLAARPALVPAAALAGSQQPAPLPADAAGGMAAAGGVATATSAAPVPGYEEYDDSLHDEDFEDEDEDFPPGTVFVVEGRPRYHVEGCRYLAGRDVEAVDVEIAQEEGFTACGVCRPDEVLAAEQDDESVQEEYEPAAGSSEPEPEPEQEQAGLAPAPAHRPAPVSASAAAPSPAPSVPGTAIGSLRRGATLASARPAPAAVADPTPPELAPVEASSPGTAPSEAAPSDGTARGEPLAAAAPAGARAARADTPPAAARRNRVVVLPDRGKFHQPACRFVRNVTGGQQLTRAAATKQGYTPCGVCRP